MNPILNAIVGAAGKVLDRIFPDEESRAAAHLELMRLAQHGELTELQNEIERLRIHQGDRADARRMQRETKGRVAPALAIATFLGFFAVLALMIFVDIPPSAEQPVAIMLGVLGTLVMTIATYYFGSSDGSRAKQQLIDRIMTGGEEEEESA